MLRYAAFLRGINLAGRRTSSAQLCAAFEKMGFEQPATFRASGNVVFGAEGDPVRLAGRIERGLVDTLGYEVRTFVRSATEVRAIAAHQPFDEKQPAAGRGKLQVVLLAAKPTARVRKAVLALRSDEDLLSVRGREVYWLPAGGLMQSAIGMSGIHDVVGINTIRTKGTVEQIAARFFADRHPARRRG